MYFYVGKEVKVYTYAQYIENLFKLLSRDLEYDLFNSFLRYKYSNRRIKRLKESICIDINKTSAFYFITPKQVVVDIDNDVHVDVRIATNPSIYPINEKELALFIRCASTGSNFDHTFIAMTRVALEAVHREPIRVKPVIVPLLPYENIEDPRIFRRVEGYEVFHVRSFKSNHIDGVLTFLAKIADLTENIMDMHIVPIIFRSKLYGDVIIRDCRDSFALNSDIMVLRPFFRYSKQGGIALAPRKDYVVFIDDIIFIPELLPQDDEIKTGGNIAIAIGSNEHLLIYHAVDTYGLYHIYAAILDSNGNLLGMTSKPILSPGILPRAFCSGRRPGTLFVCGAAKLHEEILVSLGIDDEFSMIIAIPFEEILNCISWIT